MIIDVGINKMLPETFGHLLTRCALLKDVRCEVIKNHDDNLWWPLTIDDWRLRLLIAGLSTRISYSMINTYRFVISNMETLGYEAVCQMTDQQLYNLLAPLGLHSTRAGFVRSMASFIHSHEHLYDLVNLPNDELITLIRTHVDGADYKVAQCCTLYAKGYYCGVIPIDSGMKDKLARCFGLRISHRPAGHEEMRREIENLVSQIDTRQIALQTGYNNLRFPKAGPLTWWTHLILIYYKRLYCNRPGPVCPIRQSQDGSTSSCYLHHE